MKVVMEKRGRCLCRKGEGLLAKKHFQKIFIHHVSDGESAQAVA